MLNFGKLYDIVSDEEKKSIITYLIKEIQIYPHGESEMPLKSIEFNFPIYQRTCADQMQDLRARDRLQCFGDEKITKIAAQVLGFDLGL